MKKLISLIVLLSATSIFAQDTNSSPQTFFQTVEKYFTQFNTNLTTFNADHFNLSVGSVTVDNNQMAADLLAEFNVARPVSLEVDIRNTTVAGTILSYQGGLGYSIVHYDTRVTGFLDAGYKTDVNLPYVAPGLRVKKALTENTYAGASIELDIYFRRQSLSPTYTIFTGFKF